MQRDRIISLDTIYNDGRGPVFMSGIQALVRLPLAQRRLDRSKGLNTAGLVSGYRGSPLGAYDQQLWKASKYLDAHQIVFQPALNEDLAATALWGAQMHRAFGPTKVEGVFGIWYGKGNGVDRTGDAFRNANVLGTSALGGVLAIGGDDHAAQSSMFPHQTDGIFHSVLMPVLQPANVAEILSLGLAGFALSRFCGLWVAMKTIAEVVESAASFELPDPYPIFLRPEGVVPAHGLNWDPSIGWPAQRMELERRVIEERLPAAIAWARLNRIDRPVLRCVAKRLCVVTVGKAHQDLMQAFDDLGIGTLIAETLGLAVYKVAMSWPLDIESLLDFSDGFEEILVIEEKQAVVENQIKTGLYNRPVAHRPRITGKNDSTGAPLLPIALEFSPLQVARVLVGRLQRAVPAVIAERLTELEARNQAEASLQFPVRKPVFCAGCPHNSSTRTPDGSMSGGGIGCHVMVLSQPTLKTSTFSQMGGEGMQWVGAAPFSETKHIFQNMGDGTYQHSGLLAIRASVASKANITFKILYNDAVAMTGGQPAEGSNDPARITRQLAAEGVGEIRLVSDDPERWANVSDLAPGVKVHHRDELDAVQRALREIPGVTAVVYEQPCAAEKRRRHKRGDLPDAGRRLFINPRVCEGCGDCSVRSNCIAIEPVETEFGRKRRINQSSCNTDFSCVKGFCPSFVEIDGSLVRRPDDDRLKLIEAKRFPALPEPNVQPNHDIFNIYVAGIGGLGVLTVGALLGSAAHLDGQSSTVLNFTGLAQKNGAVVSQVRIAPAGEPIHAVRIGTGAIDLLLGIDVVVAAGADALTKLDCVRSGIVLNTAETPTADAITDRDAALPMQQMVKALMDRAGKQAFQLHATSLAEGLFGNGIAVNTLLVGYAWQKGLIPVTRDAIRGAIQASGAAIALNLRAFEWGRMTAIDMAEVAHIAGISAIAAAEETIVAVVERRIDDLRAYQNAAYASRYRALVERAQKAARPLGVAGDGFVRAVAVNGYKVMAYKDEYEVARLYADPSFKAGLEAQFSESRRLSVYLAPPILARMDPMTGRPAKRKFGPWIFKAFGLLANMKALRGTWADPFGYTHERRAERQLVNEYFTLIEHLATRLTNATVSIAIELASIPNEIRGYGQVKAEAMARAGTRRIALFSSLDAAHSPFPSREAV